MHSSTAFSNSSLINRPKLFFPSLFYSICVNTIKLGPTIRKRDNYYFRKCEQQRFPVGYKRRSLRAVIGLSLYFHVGRIKNVKIFLESVGKSSANEHAISSTCYTYLDYLLLVLRSRRRTEWIVRIKIPW